MCCALSDQCTVLDICFLVDNSGSIRDRNPPDRSYDNWDLQLQFIIDIINEDRIKIGVNDVQVRSKNNCMFFIISIFITFDYSCCIFIGIKLWRANRDFLRYLWISIIPFSISEIKLFLDIKKSFFDIQEWIFNIHNYSWISIIRISYIHNSSTDINNCICGYP